MLGREFYLNLNRQLQRRVLGKACTFLIDRDDPICSGGGPLLSDSRLLSDSLGPELQIPGSSQIAWGQNYRFRVPLRFLGARITDSGSSQIPWGQNYRFGAPTNLSKPLQI